MESTIDFFFSLYYDILGPVFDILFYAVLLIALPAASFQSARWVSRLVLRVGGGVFLLSGWIYSVAVALNFTGWIGLILGLMFAGIGHIFVAFFSALMHGSFDFAGGIAYPIVLGVGALAIASWLGSKSQ